MNKVKPDGTILHMAGKLTNLEGVGYVLNQSKVSVEFMLYPFLGKNIKITVEELERLNEK